MNRVLRSAAAAAAIAVPAVSWAARPALAAPDHPASPSSVRTVVQPAGAAPAAPAALQNVTSLVTVSAGHDAFRPYTKVVGPTVPSTTPCGPKHFTFSLTNKTKFAQTFLVSGTSLTKSPVPPAAVIYECNATPNVQLVIRVKYHPDPVLTAQTS